MTRKCSNYVKLKQDVGRVTVKRCNKNGNKPPKCDNFGYVVGQTRDKWQL